MNDKFKYEFKIGRLFVDAARWVSLGRRGTASQMVYRWSRSDEMAALNTLIDRLLFRHSRNLGERYGEHARIAIGFAFGMIGGGAKCLVHAIVPGLFETAASDRIRALHAELDWRRARAADAYPDYVI
jgi:hypothetical protein